MDYNLNNYTTKQSRVIKALKNIKHGASGLIYVDDIMIYSMKHSSVIGVLYELKKKGVVHIAEYETKSGKYSHYMTEKLVDFNKFNFTE